MTGPLRFRHLAWGGVLLWAALFAVAAILLRPQLADPALRGSSAVALAACAAATLAFLAALLLLLQRTVLRPLALLGREVELLARVNPGHTVELPAGHLLGPIPAAVNELGAALWRATREVAETVSAASCDLEHNKARLEDILQALGDGIIVCDDRARIMFYNAAARRVFHDNVALSLGRSLALLCASAPIEGSVEILRQRRIRPAGDGSAEDEVSFVCTTPPGAILSCRMRLLPAVPGLSWSFLLTCEDISRAVETGGRRERLLRETVKRMRAPLTGLSLGLESLELLPELDSAERAGLERAIAGEARSLVGSFEVLAREIEEIDSPRYLIRDILSGDLVAVVARRLAGEGISLTLTGDPLWVRADVHALLFLLEHFARRIHGRSGAPALEIETLLGDRRVYFTFLWAGEPVPEAELGRWTAEPMTPPGVHTVAEVLERHGSEVWSTPHRTPGFATLCFPMPLSVQHGEPPPPALPERPVYADFGGFEEGAEGARFRDVPLERVPFVVFDTETTGLAPIEGDEIVSIAGVKIIARAIVVGEAFDRIVDPRRDIPPSSVRFHGITEEMARGRPAIEETLREFHAFVGDAVLVGHNAAFDLQFLRLKEEAAGVRFRGPVVDTLAISRFLHPHTPEHSLDAVARRHGVEVRDRHTALGDALITAQAMLKFIFLLRERGVATLGDLREALRR